MPASQLRHTKCAQAPLPSFVYVEDAQPLAIALNDLAIVDVTDAQLGAAYVRLQPLVAGDELAVRDDVAQTAGFAWHFNRQSGELLVLRKKPIGDYVKLLRDALTFHTASQLPDTRRRTVLMQVEDAGEGQPFPMRSTSGSFKDGFTEVGFIDVISVNDPIIFGAADASTARKFIAGRAPAMLLPNVTVHDADNATVVSLTISVDAGFERGSDLLVFDGRTDWGGLAPPVVTAANASLSLELAPAAAGAAGAGALAQYRSALRAVRFVSTDPHSDAPRTVRVSAFDGVVATQFTLRVLVVTPVRFPRQPVLLSGSKPQVAAPEPGQPLVLNLTATGTAPLRYRWERRDAASGGVLPWEPALARNGPLLDFIRLMHGDGGVYSCVVTNEAGGFTSGNVTLAVADAPPTWVDHQRRLIAPTVLAQTNKLIMLSWGEPQWNGHAANEASPYQLEFREGQGAWRSSVVTLKGAMPLEILNDADTNMSASYERWSFRVGATNDAGQRSPNASTVLSDVVANPRSPVWVVNLVPRTEARDPGAAFTLEVLSDANPKPTYQWWRNGIPVQGQTAKKLNLLAVIKKDHDGDFTCVATNYRSSVASLAVKLLVNTLPVVTAFSRTPSTKVVAGTEVVFTCEATGTPAPDIVWLRNGTVNSEMGVQSGSNWRFVAESSEETAQPTDVYRCAARNSVGQAMSPPIAVELQSCNPGFWRDASGYCHACPLGRHMTSKEHRESECVRCAAGEFASGRGASSCQLCGQGWFQEEKESSECMRCPKGKFQYQEGSSQCLGCPAGRFSATTSTTSCEVCPFGMFESGSGATACRDCPAGRIDGGQEKALCAECEPGQFKTLPGNGSCVYCDDNMESNRLRTDCDCRHSFFTTASDMTMTGKQCTACTQGMVCNTTGLLFSEVTSAPGYWEVTSWFNSTPALQQRLAMRKCETRTEPVCLGGSDDLEVGTTCRKGHTGPLCSVCAEGFQLGAGGLCRDCSVASEITDTMVTFFLITTSAMVMFSLLIVHKRHAIVVKWRAAWDRAKRRVGCPSRDHKKHGKPKNRKHNLTKDVMMKVKILLGLFQVSSTFVGNFEIAWPPVFSNFVIGFSIFNVDLPNMGCLADINFVDKFLSSVLAPICIGAPFLVTFIIFTVVFAASGRPRIHEDGALDAVLHVRNMSLKAIIYLLFLVYPSTSSTILKMFDCTKLGNGKSYLSSDMSIECADVTAHTQMLGSQYTYIWYRDFAAFMIVVYPIGVPVFFFMLLWLKRKHLYQGNTHNADPELGEELGFLYEGYARDYWWWESVELFRKLLLTGIITFISPGTPMQMFIAIMMAQTFILAYARQQPYYQMEDSDLQLVCQVQIWFTATSGLVIKLSTGTDTMHGEGDFESGLFDYVMLVATLGPMFLAQWQLLVRFKKLLKIAATDMFDHDNDDDAHHRWRTHFHVRAPSMPHIHAPHLSMNAPHLPSLRSGNKKDSAVGALTVAKEKTSFSLTSSFKVKSLFANGLSTADPGKKVIV